MTLRGASSASGWIAARKRLPAASSRTAPSPPEGFGDEEGGTVAADERGGVELDELEVANDRACAEGEAEAVSGGDGGVGGVGVERAGAAGGEDGGDGGDRGVLAGRAGDDCADAAAGFECEFDGGVGLAEVDVAALDALFEGALDVQPGAVAAGVEDAGLGVRALLSERDSAVWGAVEVDAEIDQASDGGWPLGGEDFDGRFVAEPVAGADRVGGVALGVIGRGDGGGDAALGAVGIGLADGALADQADGAVLTGQQGGIEAGETGADDQEVDVLGHGVGVQSACESRAGRWRS